VTIPKRVTSIGSYAFLDCAGLTTISIPASVGIVGDGAFSGCTSLRSITLPGNVKSLGNEVFSGCASLAAVKIGSGLKAVGTGVFEDCASLTNVSIPGSVRSIGAYAFSACTSLAGVTIPGSVTSLGNNLFSGCSSLAKVTIPNSVSSIGDYAFSGCVSLTAVALPSKVTSTGNYTFLGCTNLSGITIPSSVTAIGDYAFSGCALANITIPSSVTSIGADAFLDCTSLTTVKIPASVTIVGYEAFSGCGALTGVFFAGDAPTTVDSDVFLGAPDAKVYYCAPTTGWGSSFSDAPTVPVTAPMIIQPPSSQSASVGSKATFSLSAFGPLPISYQWQFDGASISGARNSTFTLSSVRTSNAGDYTVIASNSYGSATSSPPAVLSVAAVAGNYRGLITAGNSFDITNSGAFLLTVTPGGAFSAKLTFPTQTTSASGRLALSGGQTGAATAQFTSQIGGRAVEVLISLALDSSTAVSGSLTALGDPRPLAQIDGAMAVHPANAGLFDVALLSATTNQPAGDGYGSILVSTTGTIINLTLADEGAVITALASDVLKNGAIPVFAPLYRQKGFLSGWLTLTHLQVVSEFPLAWHKEAGATTAFFAEGFNQWVSVQGGGSDSVTKVPIDSQPLSTP
jgi:hypothetical protein